MGFNVRKPGFVAGNHLFLKKALNACADPESVFRGGPVFLMFFCVFF